MMIIKQIVFTECLVKIMTYKHHMDKFQIDIQLTNGKTHQKTREKINLGKNIIQRRGS